MLSLSTPTTNIDFARKHPDDAQMEIYNRELASRSLIDFITYTYPHYVPEAFHVQICELLEQVITGDIRRLMIFAPPQHGKSEAVSVRFPAYWMAKKPGLPVILCSYGALLAWEKTASCMNIIYGDDYIKLFPEMFKDAPRLHRGGRRVIMKNPNNKIYAAGVRGAITGRGGGLGIIDDPVKDWREAYSLTMRESTWQWWRGTFRSRIWAEGRIIIIMTRWHEDDLAGRILNESGEKWTVVRYTALAESAEEIDINNKKYLKSAKQIFTGDPLNREKGEPLCPIRFDLPALLDLQHDVGPRAWSAEYQGTPRPVEGNMIKQEWLHYVDEWPHGDIQCYVRYWDKAATKDGGCKTAGLLLAMTKQKTYYVLDIVTGQWSTFQREEQIKNIAERDSQTYGTVDTWIEMEPGSGGIDSAQYTIKNLAGYSIRSERARDSKEVRMEPVSSQMEAGNVFILNRKWTWEFTDELLMWPNGTFKDQGDALTGAFRKCTSGNWSRSGG
jgi:predicted phage terminase large subunit-like protein